MKPINFLLAVGKGSNVVMRKTVFGHVIHS